MKQNNIIPSVRRMKQCNLPVAVLLSVVAGLVVSCGEDVGDDSLPDGKYPITFTAAVDGLNTTRAAGKDAWTKDDPIAVSLNESSDSKIYKITKASNGAMEPVNPSDVYYWKTNTEELKILAWYPAEAVTDKNISDQSQGFADFDYLKAETTAKFSATGAVSLSFVHQMAKVTCTLEAGNNITDISHATVSFYGYTTASFSKGAVTAGSGSSNGWITPTSDKEVLVVPQDMKGQQFIRVTISGREYFYTPGENDANLEAGKQYNYVIKVTETGLEVMVTGNGTSWTDESITGNSDTGVTYQITAPTTGVTIAKTEDAATLTDNSGGSYTLSGGNAITVTVDASSQSDKFLKGLSTKGIYDITSGSYASGSYTYTYILKSDLSFSDPVFVNKTTPALGDFYYCDGTWSAELWDKPCIGIVFKSGAGTNDALNDYGNKLTGQINGYAVAVQDAARFNIKWSTVEENCGTSTSTSDYKGYENTAKVVGVTNYSPEKYPVFGAVSEFGKTTVAPSSSSGWYLPSAGQMIDIVNSWKSNGIIWQKLDALPYSYSWKIPTTNHGYATSTEDPNNASRNVCRIGSSGGVAKEQKDFYAGNFAVRPVLTF